MKTIRLVAAVLVAGWLSTGCMKTWAPDGQIAGTVDLDAFESALNTAGAAFKVPRAGTILVNLDNAAVAKWGAKPGIQFPLEGVNTNYFDADDQPCRPPFRAEYVPTYGKVVKEIDPLATPPPAAEVKMDSATVAQLLALIKANQAGAATPSPQPAVSGENLSDAEKAALRVLGIDVP
jgi:hypothetical protein